MDISQTNWNEVDGSNTAAAPDGSPEGMAPSGVNNVLRAHQGAIKRNWKRNSVMVTTGAAGAYLVTHTVPPTALADGETELVQWHVANTAGATLDVGGLGAVPVHYYSAGAWRLVPAGLWGAEQTLRVAYHASSAAYRIIDLPDRTGEVSAFAGDVAPAGSLLLHGQTIGRTAYAGLFALLGTTYGVGDGSTTFHLPDLRGRVAAGRGNMGGGAPANRLTSATITPTGDHLGGTGGQELGNYSVSGSMSGTGTAVQNDIVTTHGEGGELEMTSGTHWVALLAHSHRLNVNAAVSVSGSISGTTSGTNVQPTIILSYVIRI